jgi:hypothetical protein
MADDGEGAFERRAAARVRLRAEPERRSRMTKPDWSSTEPEVLHGRRDMLRMLGLGASALVLGLQPWEAAPAMAKKPKPPATPPSPTVTTTTTVTAPVSTVSAAAGSLWKGVGRPGDARESWTADIDALTVSWWYDWWSGAADQHALAGVQYVPMIFRDWTNGGCPSPATAAASGSKILLGFNEPDLPTQGNVSVARALELWPRLVETGCRLGSPAGSSGHAGRQWLAQFMAAGPKVDFICAHWYVEYSPDALADYLDALWNTYHLPVWLTEVGSLQGGEAANAALIPKVLDVLASRPFVERVAWFATREGDGWKGVGLVSAAGTLTAPGSVYAAHSPNIAR